jgi:hypothetical protein
MQRNREIRRDCEAIMLTHQNSIADDGDSVPGQLAGLGAWLETNTNRGAGGVDGGFGRDVPTLVAEPGHGTKRALTETAVRDVAQAVYEAGGDPTLLMSTPGAIRKLSEYMFSASARIATLTRETAPSESAATALGSVNVFVTDFGVVLQMIPNRLQQPYGVDPDVVDVYLIDPMYLRKGKLHGLRVEPLAKTGLADKRQIAVDYTLKVLNEEAHGVIADVDQTLAVTDV